MWPHTLAFMLAQLPTSDMREVLSFKKKKNSTLKGVSMDSKLMTTAE